MRREISWGEEALSELDDIRERVETQTAGRGWKFLEAVDGILSSLTDFPSQGSPVATDLNIVIRRVRLRVFGVLLYYTVYPSVDLQSGEVLDVVYVLACRHERQGEPPWGARDPFRV